MPLTVDYAGHLELLRLSPEGTRLALAQRWREGEGGEELLVVAVPSGKAVARYTGLDGVTDALFRSEDELFILHGSECVLCGFKRKSRKVIRQADIEARGGPVYNASLSPDGRTLAVGTDGALLLLDVARKRVQATLPTPLGGVVYASAFAPDGRLIAATSSGPFRGIAFGLAWDVQGQEPVRLLKLNAQESDALAFRPDGRLLAVHTDSSISLYGMDDPWLRRCDVDWTTGASSHESELLYGIGWTEPRSVLYARGEGSYSIVDSLSFSGSGKILKVLCYGGAAVRVAPPGGRVLSEALPPEDYRGKVRMATINERGGAAGIVENAVLFWDVPRWGS